MCEDKECRSPNDSNACPGGKPGPQVALEAMQRCDQRKKWRDDHPGAMMAEQNCDQIHRDYEDAERWDHLMAPGGATFEPGDGLVSRKG
jgi:hypothetical protein